MSRTPLRDHLYRHLVLRELWLFVPGLYALLLPNQQWEVHELYRPSEYFEDDNDLIDYVRVTIAANPSLPNRVGKHWKRMNDTYRWAADIAGHEEDWRTIARLVAQARLVGTRVICFDPQLKRQMTAAPVIQPQLDVEKFVRALIKQVEWEKKGGHRPDGPSS